MSQSDEIFYRHFNTFVVFPVHVFTYPISINIYMYQQCVRTCVGRNESLDRKHVTLNFKCHYSQRSSFFK